MPSAIVLINAEIGSEEEVFNEISKVKEVTEAYVVYGVYDVIVKIEAETMDKLKEVVASQIRKLPKVRSTLTMIIVEGKELKKK
ncbi:MAG: Lrp/AsnC family transcriptional regulator [Fervidicoccaceae archaeon]|jgi:DNA-binding Lrp family transcriptional regulator|uniref:Lrp/AsnC family transcriptional regulator n=1 Tax=Fervidicoccus fontis TaxID=683846 RepID=A0A7C2YHF9_9CREN|nr:MAG: AsnC family transcriptional regulator [Fervidicoccus sp.]HEU97777.1 Lrp/AsnC family transcriptional regulator [Fervidicoccus fontis]